LDHSYLKRIKRVIQGNADDSDIKFIESLLAEGKNNPLLQEMIKMDFESILNEPAKDEFNSTRLLSIIHEKIGTNRPVREYRVINRLTRIYMKVAAILLLPVIISAWVFISQIKNITPDSGLSYFDIYAPLGSRVSFTLPDGTRGMLNGGSQLKYALPFDNREIRLEGEAWFSVKHDELHPFRIVADDSRIEVLGTKLNVNADSEKKYVEVILQEGIVDFYGNNETEKVSLQPSERLILQGGMLQKSFVDTAKYTSWTQGKLTFRGDAMSEVARRIERWYNVNVNISDSELEKYSFRATFQDDPVEEVIRCLALTSPIQYKIIPRKLSEDGIYQKTEVVIYKTK
jgi:transmembrane sensor